MRHLAVAFGNRDFSGGIRRRDPHRSIAILFGKEKLDWCGYPKVRKVL